MGTKFINLKPTTTNRLYYVILALNGTATMTRFILTLIVCTSAFLLTLNKTRATEPAPNVLTQEQQAQLTPQNILDELMAGNSRFVSNNLTERDHSRQVREAYAGQFPKAVILSCLDSRIPVEDVFDRGVGDIFVARVAGNFINEDILGSMEFACRVAGAKLIIVLGHTHCGAVQAAIDNVQLGNITPMLAKIRPALKTAQPFTGNKTSANPEYVAHICCENIRMAVRMIQKESEILKALKDSGSIDIVGAYYDLSSGTVSLVEGK